MCLKNYITILAYLKTLEPINYRFCTSLATVNQINALVGTSKLFTLFYVCRYVKKLYTPGKLICCQT